MKVVTVSYGQTVSKNYQAIKAEYTISVEPGESHEKALAVAKALTQRALGLGPTKAEIAAAERILVADESAKLIAELERSVTAATAPPAKRYTDEWPEPMPDPQAVVDANRVRQGR